MPTELEEDGKESNLPLGVAPPRRPVALVPSFTTHHPHKQKRERKEHLYPHTIIYGTFTVGQPSLSSTLSLSARGDELPQGNCQNLVRCPRSISWLTFRLSPLPREYIALQQ